MRYDIQTIEGLVDLLGGDTVIAERLGISQAAVGMWKVRGQIASGWHLRLFAEVHNLGRTVDPRIFGLTEAHLGSLLRRPRSRPPRSIAAA